MTRSEERRVWKDCVSSLSKTNETKRKQIKTRLAKTKPTNKQFVLQTDEDIGATYLTTVQTSALTFVMFKFYYHFLSIRLIIYIHAKKNFTIISVKIKALKSLFDFDFGFISF